MKILNLSKPKQRDFGLEIQKFPDGQQNVIITPNEHSDDDLENVTIKSRFNSFKDLELIICATNALKNLGHKKISLYIPYILGGRSDRQFTRGSVNYIKQIVAPIINAQSYEKVYIRNPHSDVTEACINNIEKIDEFNEELFCYAFSKSGDKNRPFYLISPDAGAMKKVWELSSILKRQEFKLLGVEIANKHRNLETGKIDHTSISRTHFDEDVFIVDDICDGGRSFIEIAKLIKAPRIFLVVTHGIFSAGLEELRKYFTGIYTTTSIKDIYDYEDFIYQMDVLA